jgi:ABC-type multidrug transport system fused ATPase/permease subunit
VDQMLQQLRGIITRNATHTHPDDAKKESMDTMTVPAQQIPFMESITNETEHSPSAEVLVEAFRRGFGGGCSGDGTRDVDLRLSFEFDELSLTLSNGKTILNGISGSIRAGRMTAIMGPSGVGS